MKRMKRLLMIQLIFYLVYLLLIILGIFLLCNLIPDDVRQAVQETYFSDNPG
ncbi:MAG: hypothetical protein KAY37_09340 [Phycisphaerae bacterium]|nr:hypothetical protein [Phycisphaerae bacterium]